MPTKLITVDLEQLLPERIDGAEQYDRVWAIVLLQGVPLGQVEIDNLRTPVLADQLRIELVRQLGNVLIKKRDHADPAFTDFALPDNLDASCFLPESAPRSNQGHFLSVVVCTRDRPDDLRNCLQSLTQLRMGKHRLEIVVVDNNPDSGLTSQIVSAFPEVRYEEEHRPGVAYCRNKGLTKARGDIIAMVDDDVVVPPDWSARILAPFADGRVMCVSGLVLPLALDSHSQEMFEKYGGLGRGYRHRLFDRRSFHKSKKHVVHTWELGGTANMALRRTVLADSGMFDETLGPGLPTGVGEDIYMFYRILKAGHICYYEPAAYVWHKHRADMRALRRQLYNYNKGHTSYQLRTLITDGDRRALRQLLWDLPKWHARRIVEILLGRQDYSLRLVLVEIWGNLVGPLAFWRAVRMHQRLNGSGANPIDPGQVL